MPGTKRSAGSETAQGLAAVREIPVWRNSVAEEPVIDPVSFFLRTKRLGFRTWKEQDVLLAIGLWGDPQVTRFIDARRRLSEEDVKELLENQIDAQRQNGIQYWPLFLIESGEHVGCCGLRPYDPTNSVYELGVHIRSGYWRQGFAEEAAAAMMDYAFGKLGVSALFAGHHPGNSASQKLLDKLGFQFTHMQHYAPTGLQHRSYIRTRGVTPLPLR